MTTANVNEIASSGNLYYSNDRVYANISPLLTTANVSEVTNLYFTNTRVLTALTGNVTIGNLSTTGQIVSTAPGSAETGAGQIYLNGATNNRIDWAATGTGAPAFTTRSNGTKVVLYPSISASTTDYAIGIDAATMWSSVPEYGDSFKFKWFGATTEIASLSGTGTFIVKTIQTTGNIQTDGNLIANGLIIRNINVSDGVLTGNITANATTSNTIVAVTVYATGNIITDANLIANGLIIRNINVSDTVLSGNVTAGTTTSNVILADSVTANIWNRLYTANIIESDSNLFYTNARTRSALSAGSGISYDNTTGVISSAITTILSDSVTVISTGNLSYNIGTSVSDPKRILVSIEGMLQIPTTDYSVSGSTLIFPSAPPVGANIEVKFFGTETLNSTPTLVSKVDTFVATGSSAVFNLSMLPTSKDYVTVLIDGVLQQSDVYTLSGNTITLSDSPAVGSNVDIRMIGGRVGSSYNTRTFTGNGAANTFALTNGFTNDTVLVFENGVAQMPGSDYTITNDVLTFTTAPAANVIVQVRELGIAGPNVAAAISGFDQVTGNLVPTLDLIKNLGSSTKRWNQLYLKSNGLILGNVTIGATDTTLTLTSNTGATTTLYTSLTAARAVAFGLSLIFGG